MRVDEFDFVLPENLIALRPAVPRDAARMLVVDANGGLSHKSVRDLPDLLSTGDQLVVNDTKVIRARLRGHRIGRGATRPKVEVMLLKRTGGDTFLALARPARKLVAGDTVCVGKQLLSRVLRRGVGGEVELQFELSGTALDAAIASEGEVPLPPYIRSKRAADDRDCADYQSIFARHIGSVAAPTASLHFTHELLMRLSTHGVGLEHVTLDVGAGTFLPVSSTDTDQHRMHTEFARLQSGAAARLRAAKAASGRIVAVGTTALRTLETAATENGRLLPYAGETDIFIVPGYRFKAVDILVTNFHLPRSTLFMLVSAFCGLEVMRAAYAEAIREHYRFYSYGDACLLFRPMS